MSEKIAKYLAIVLGPHIWLPVLFVLIIFKSGLNNRQLTIIFPSVLVLQVIIPILYLIAAPKLSWAGEWDMKSKFINFLFNWKLPLLYLIIPIIFWARLKLKKHTAKQLAAGIIVTSFVTLFELRLFGYL